MFGIKTSAPARPVVLLAGVPDPVRHQGQMRVDGLLARARDCCSAIDLGSLQCAACVVGSGWVRGATVRSVRACGHMWFGMCSCEGWGEALARRTAVGASLRSRSSSIALFVLGVCAQ